MSVPAVGKLARTDPSDGYLLTQAYNCAVLSSPHPWGFIPVRDIHDTILPSAHEGEEVREKEREWTFRRVGNLTCWAA